MSQNSTVNAAVTLSDAQRDARDAVLKWWRNPPKGQTPVFTIAGFAGTGKSTIVNQVIRDLGLPPDAVAFVTFTGKAALVLNNKGVPAVTVHRLIYIPIVVKYTDKDGRQKERVAGFKLRKPDDPALAAIQLIVVDEVSMIGGNLLTDLLSFGWAVLALGDPGQLPPVQDNGNFLLKSPNVFLSEVHRQAAGNPILWASMRVREGHQLAYGVYGGTEIGVAPLSVVPKTYLTHELLAKTDQVICGRNETRRFLNTAIRQHLGRAGMPQVGDKLICLKNNWNEASTQMSPLVNGWLARVTKTGRVDKRGRTCILNVEGWDDPDNKFFALETNLDFFEQPEGAKEKPNTHGRSEHFDFGYAITCHKSQGSEFDSVIYMHEPFGGAEFSRRLLYTGITRAAKSLIVVV